VHELVWIKLKDSKMKWKHYSPTAVLHYLCAWAACLQPGIWKECWSSHGQLDRQQYRLTFYEHEFVFLPQHITATPFKATFYTHFHTLYDNSNPWSQTAPTICFLDSAITQYEHSKSNVLVWLTVGNTEWPVLYYHL